ncbi:MAG: peptidoglycan-binding protein [Deltaproteobacteria bacterium]|nr:peptidoglycan-binding protein [Deltaproteobacteria bacterium]
MKVHRLSVRPSSSPSVDTSAPSRSSTPAAASDGFDAAPVHRDLVHTTARATLKQGASGSDVVALQQALTALGYDTGGADGSFGPHTLAAVKQFQAAQGLTADGVVGPMTWAALDAASAGSSTPVTPPTNPQPAPAGDVYALGSGASSLGLSYTGTSTSINAVHTSSGAVGAFAFQSKLDIDSDGATGITHSQDPWHQDQTSLKFADGYVDAKTVPYIVLPPSLARAGGAKLGDLVQVSYNGKSVYAIYADVGPSTKLGEGSMALASQLGINPDPRYGGMDSQKVKMVVLPGSGAQQGIVAGGPSVSFDDVQQKGAAAFANAAAQGYVQG